MVCSSFYFSDQIIIIIIIIIIFLVFHPHVIEMSYSSGIA
jgi:hypothetical protein